VISRTGEKLPLYTDLYYGVINKRSGRLWTNYIKLDSVSQIDPRNRSHWSIISKVNKVSTNLVDYHNSYSFKPDLTFYIEKTDQDYYRVIYLAKMNLTIKFV
jgi:hypothetical protein